MNSNNRPLKPSLITKLNEVYEVTIEVVEESSIAPFEFPLKIIYDDNEVIVINKPSGLVVHPAAGHHRDTLINALKYHRIKLSSGFNSERPGLVHRIDKDTSGLIVLAKNDSAHRFLAEQFREKSVHRSYWALASGLAQRPAGTFISFLLRDPANRKKFASVRNNDRERPLGKRAVTHYKVIKSHPLGFSLLHCRLETGRTHQIRVHLSENNLPLVGDPIYGPQRIAKQGSRIAKMAPHLMLHAAELGFVHPKSKKNVQFSVGWPEECHPILEELQFL